MLAAGASLLGVIDPTPGNLFKRGLGRFGSEGGITRLWRAVEPEELADVKRFGDYNIHPNSTFKRFAFDEKSLDDFIKANPGRTYKKTYIESMPTNLTAWSSTQTQGA